jgi:RsmE family RNA methyltransferase
VNLVLLEPGELDADGVAELAPDDVRARHILDVLGAQTGQTLRVGIIDGPIGTAEVLETAPRLRLRFSPEGVPPRPRIDLALAVPRPKAMNRLWPVLSSLGLGRIWLLNAWKTERAYFGAHALLPENIRAGLLEGLAQARDTLLPEVRFARAFKPWLEDEVPAAGHAIRLVAHPGGDGAAARHALETAPPDARVLLAVGPEGGWTDYELGRFGEAGFLRISLGERILRTDTAIVSLHSRVALLLGGEGGKGP